MLICIIEVLKMNKKTKLTIFFAFILTILSGALYLARADDDHKGKNREEEHERHGGENHNERYLKQVNNPTYKEECGACHFVYQPELLPSASWMEILANLDDHHGQKIELDSESIIMISEYLKSNSAENSSAKLAVKIMRSLGSRVPTRITDAPYIREKHHEINPEVFKRESIGSLSNCIACHTTADKGIYEEDIVKIPR